MASYKNTKTKGESNMNISDFQNFMLLTEKGHGGEEKLISLHNDPLDLTLYLAVGFPFNCNSPDGIWAFIVTKRWVLEFIDRIINVSESNGNLYTLKNIKGSRSKVPTLTKDLFSDMKKTYMVEKADGNVCMIDAAPSEYIEVLRKHIPTVKAELENRLKARAIGRNDAENINNEWDDLRDCIDIMCPWYGPEIDQAKQRITPEAYHNCLVRIAVADRAIDKMTSLRNLYTDESVARKYSNMDMLDEAYNQAIQSVIKQGMELYDVCIGVQPNQSSPVYQIKAITAKPKEFANWLQSEKYKNAKVTIISSNKINGSSVEGKSNSGNKPNLTKEPMPSAVSVNETSPKNMKELDKDFHDTLHEFKSRAGEVLKNGEVITYKYSESNPEGHFIGDATLENHRNKLSQLWKQMHTGNSYDYIDMMLDEIYEPALATASKRIDYITANKEYVTVYGAVDKIIGILRSIIPVYMKEIKAEVSKAVMPKKKISAFKNFSSSVMNWINSGKFENPETTKATLRNQVLTRISKISLNNDTSIIDVAILLNDEGKSIGYDVLMLDERFGTRSELSKCRQRA